jgi:hypothetical protein
VQRTKNLRCVKYFFAPLRLAALVVRQVITVFAIVLMTMWTATEWTAWRLGFQASLTSCRPVPPWRGSRICSIAQAA